MAYVDVFSGGAVRPAEVSYRAISLTSPVLSTTLVWPAQGVNGDNAAARIMDLNGIGGGSPTFSLVMPPANETATGPIALLNNIGSNDWTIKDTSGNTIASLVASAALYLYLTNNSTANGTWRTFEFSTGTSSASAAALAGDGLVAIGGLLNSQIATIETSAANLAIDETYRAQSVLFTGGEAEWTLLPILDIENAGFFFLMRNKGTGTINIIPATGDTIDGEANFRVNPGESCIIVAFDGTPKWYTIGLGRLVNFNYSASSIDVTAGGSITLTATQVAGKILKFIGTPGAPVLINMPLIASPYFIENQATQDVFIDTTLVGTGSRVIFWGNGVTASLPYTGQPSVATVGASTIIAIGSNSQKTNSKVVSTLLTNVSGATVTATNLIPDGALVIGVSTRVTTALGGGGGTTGYQVGDGVDPDRWGNVTGTAVGTDTDNTDATSTTVSLFTSANNVVITANGGNFNGTGAIRVSAHYLDITAPTG